MSVARFRVHPGREAEFAALAAECVRLVREKDPGTTLYEWFLSPDRTECIAIDSYESSEAVIAHARNVGPTMRRIRSIADVEVELLGEPSPQLLETLQFTAKPAYPFLDGLGPGAG